MKIVIAYNQPGKNALEDELDILHEVALVSGCLKELGHHPIELLMTLNLAEAFASFRTRNPTLFSTWLNHWKITVLLSILYRHCSKFCRSPTRVIPLSQCSSPQAKPSPNKLF